MAGLYAEPVSLKGIRLYAAEIRKQFNIPEGEYVDIVRVYEYILQDLGIEIEIVSEEEMKDKHGETILVENRIRIREDVYNRACDGYGRDRFTMAHELGHLLIHTHERLTLTRYDGEVPPYADPEWQANAFAGEFLAPYKFIKEMSIPEIMEKYGVTQSAANVQKFRKL